MEKKSVVPLLVLPLVWGCYYVASNASVEHMSVFSVGIVIRFVTMILLTVLMLTRGEMKALLDVDHVWPRLILIGILGFLLDVTAFIGLTLCPAGIGTVLLKTDILFVNLISVVVYHYRFSGKDWLFTLIMLGGVVLVMGVDFSRANMGGVGNIFFILSAMFVSINAFVIKSVQHDGIHPVSDNVIAYYNNFITMLFFIAFAGAHGDIAQLAKIGRDRYLTVALLAASVGQTLVYLIYYHNLRNFPVWIVKVFLLLMPVVATVICFFLFGEKMIGSQYLGMAIILLGAAGILVEQGRKKQSVLISPKV